MYYHISNLKCHSRSNLSRFYPPHMYKHRLQLLNIVDRKTHHVKNCSWQLIDRSQIHTEVYKSSRFLKTCTSNTYKSAGSIHFMGKYLTKLIDHIFCCNRCLSPLTLCEFASHLWRGVLDTTLCDKVCQWLMTGCGFSPSTPVSSTNESDRHDITEILLKVALNTIYFAKAIIWDMGSNLHGESHFIYFMYIDSC